MDGRVTGRGTGEGGGGPAVGTEFGAGAAVVGGVGERRAERWMRCAEASRAACRLTWLATADGAAAAADAAAAAVVDVVGAVGVVGVVGAAAACPWR